jgi:hypothetical protein
LRRRQQDSWLNSKKSFEIFTLRATPGSGAGGEGGAGTALDAALVACDAVSSA